MKTIKINNSLEHIMFYGYFEHAFEFYLHHLKPKEAQDAQVVEMKFVFQNIRSKLRAGTYLKPNILNSMGLKYPITINFSEEEEFWFYKIIRFKFDFLYKKTEMYFKKRKMESPSFLYYDLLSNLRTNRAVEFLRTEFFKKNK